MERRQRKTWRRVSAAFAAVISAVWVLSVLIPAIAGAAQTKAIRRVVVEDSSGKQVGLYEKSYALLIGVSKYTAGWPVLESVPGEIEQVEAVLKKQGFHVIKVLDPNGDQMKTAFEQFINQYGYEKKNRLLFFFSGHGHTRRKGKKGYLVPADAPDPRSDEKGFLIRALDMTQVLAWSRQMEAKHALFLFDSCFSGTIFKTKALPKHPPHISAVTSHPVRQFISAGSAGQEVPAKSVFVPSFVRALRGDGDADGDGYLTGTELGLYLHKHVLSYETGQTPQYGKIKDPDLDEGDFVFQPVDSSLAKARRQWAEWQKRRNKEYDQLLRMDADKSVGAQEKGEAWRGFLEVVKLDNPFSEEDNGMRTFGRTRLAYWAQKVRPVPPPRPPPPPPPRQRPQARYYRVVGVPINDVLNVRERAYHRSEKVGEVPRDGECVRFLEEGKAPNGSTWFKVAYGSITGWVHSKFLVRTNGCGRRVVEAQSGIYYNVFRVKGSDGLNVRKSPDADSPTVGEIPFNGRCVRYLESSKSPSGGTWFRVSYGGNEGWVNSRYLTRASGCKTE